jgi:hypothetical protein
MITLVAEDAKVSRVVVKVVPVFMMDNMFRSEREELFHNAPAYPLMMTMFLQWLPVPMLQPCGITCSVTKQVLGCPYLAPSSFQFRATCRARHINPCRCFFSRIYPRLL